MQPGSTSTNLIQSKSLDKEVLVLIRDGVEVVPMLRKECLDLIPQDCAVIAFRSTCDQVAGKSSMLQVTRGLVNTVHNTICERLDVCEENSIAVRIHLRHKLLVGELRDVIIAMWNGL